jgi:hypothetical protein
LHTKQQGKKKQRPQQQGTSPPPTTTTTMATPWEVVKEILKQAFCAGMLPRTLGPYDVWEMRDKYQAVEYETFRTNLNKLCKNLESQQSSTASDNAAVL